MKSEEKRLKAHNEALSAVLQGQHEIINRLTTYIETLSDKFKELNRENTALQNKVKEAEEIMLSIMDRWAHDAPPDFLEALKRAQQRMTFL